MVWAVVARSPGSPLNYRHAFHAGNFADLVKHAALLRLLAELTRPGPPLTVIDTHAGRGLYDLAGPEARKSGEAEAGILQLMRTKGAPAEFQSLIRTSDCDDNAPNTPDTMAARGLI